MAPSKPPVAGLVPAAGSADRLGALPCSKEVFPVGFRTAGGRRRPRPACACLLEAFQTAEIRQAWILLRKGKWDIPALLGRGLDPGQEDALHLAYLALDPTANVPETLDSAFPFISGYRVALGFPDILFEPRDAFRRLIDQHDAGRAEVVLGLFPTERCEKTDMVELDADQRRVRRLVIKQPDRGLDFTWSIAVWGPEFSRYLHDLVARHRVSEGRAELYVGDVIQSAIHDGLVVEGVTFPGGSYLDIGTPEDLEEACGAGS